MLKMMGLICLLGLAACQVKGSASTAKETAVSAQKSPREAKISKNGTNASKGAVDVSTDEQQRGKIDSKWKSNLEWLTWSEGLALAKKENRPLCVVVYTDWCPKCKTLGPLFQDSEVERLAKNVVMVRQNQDERPEWLSRLADFGTYVPRFLFLNAQGDVLTDIKGPVDRYPYFYTPGHIAAFQQSLKRAVEQK